MFRRSRRLTNRHRKNPTPFFKMVPPYHPISGEQANLRQDGTSPYCAMMQIAAEDTYDDYVICRGFDTRMLRFIDYEAGNPNKPGISVAKPYGKRLAGKYQIAEVYPALLPTQGNSGFDDFRQIVYTPPSPVDVQWRVGQNPGAVVGGLENGQPETLDEEIEILYDHNGKVVNWLLIDSSGDGAGKILYTIDSVSTAGSSSPYNGLKVASVTIGPKGVGVVPCNKSHLLGTSVDVVDHSGCIFNEPADDLVDRVGWAFEGVALSLKVGAAADELTPCHWVADGLCCPPEPSAGEASFLDWG